jgi:sugar phosphate isomerase/epimerase
MTAPRLSLCWLTVQGAHPLAHVDAAIAGGFDAVGLRLVPPAPTDELIPVAGNEPLMRELLARLADTGIAVLDVETVWIGPDLDIARLRPALESAQRLGTSNLLTMGNDSDEARLTDTFARLCEEAAKFGLRVGMEFAAFTKVRTIDAARRLVEAAGEPNGRVLIDTLHVARSGATPADVAALDPKWLAYYQIADARGSRPASDDALRAEARGDRYLPGEGELPLAAIVAALPAGLPVGVEAPCLEHAAKPVVERGRLAGAALRRFLDRGAASIGTRG